MAALSNHKVIFIFTHDSILIGEDGPTHQPIESLTILRSIPNLITIRPYNLYETVCAYKYALSNNGPTAIILSRQQIINYSNITQSNHIMNGAYIIYESINNCNNIESINNCNNNNNIDLIIIATGSEVELVFETIKEINNINIRIVSMLSTNIYDKQDNDYKELILPKKIKKISVEAGSTLGWYKYANYVYGIDIFGASGNINDIKKYYNFNTESLKKFIYEIHNI
jgi:transketolase